MILSSIRKYWLVMGAISALVLLRITNLSYNTLFLDEAIYIVVGKNFLQQGFSYSLPTDWIGGFPLFYPVLSAIFYEIGGSPATRFFSSLLGIWSLIMFYIFCLQLPIFSKKNESQTLALISALFLGLMPVHLWLSRFAIYDMLSFSLLLTSVVFIQKAYAINSKALMWAAGVLLFLSFAAKYTVAFLIPFVLLIPFILLVNQRNMSLLYPLLMGFIFPFSIYLLLFAPDLLLFFTSQTLSAGSGNIDEIPRIFFKSLEIWYIMAGIGIVLFRKRLLTQLTLLFFTFLPFVIHLATKNVLTMEQNTLLSAIFLIPVAALIWVKLILKFNGIGVTATAVGIAAIFYFYTLPAWVRLESFWPNTSAVMEVLQKSVDENDMILAESGDVAILALEDFVAAENIASPYYFEYEGSAEIDAYTDAISDGYFTYIQIDGSSGKLEQFQESIDRHYTEIFSEGESKIYKKNE